MAGRIRGIVGAMKAVAAERTGNSFGEEKNAGYVYDAGIDWSTPEARDWISKRISRQVNQNKKEAK